MSKSCRALGTRTLAAAAASRRRIRAYRGNVPSARGRQTGNWRFMIERNVVCPGHVSPTLLLPSLFVSHGEKDALSLRSRSRRRSLSTTHTHTHIQHVVNAFTSASRRFRVASAPTAYTQIIECIECTASEEPGVVIVRARDRAATLFKYVQYTEGRSVCRKSKRGRVRSRERLAWPCAINDFQK